MQLQKKVNTIILAPCDVKLLVPVVQKAEVKKIPVIIIDTKLNYSTVYFLKTDNIATGASAAKLLIEKLDKNGDIAIMNFVKNASSAIDREKGFVAYVKKNSNFKNHWNNLF